MIATKNTRPVRRNTKLGKKFKNMSYVFKNIVEKPKSFSTLIKVWEITVKLTRVQVI